MDNRDQQDWFEDIETIVSEPLNFKSKLAIGEDAYTSLKSIRSINAIFPNDQRQEFMPIIWHRETEYARESKQFSQFCD